MLVNLVRQECGDNQLFGAKITGGGAGGTVAVLGATGAEEAFRRVVKRYGEARSFEPHVFGHGSMGGAVLVYRELQAGKRGGLTNHGAPCYIFTHPMLGSNREVGRSHDDRQAEILIFIKERGTASIAEMATHFAVSEMTVRRVLHKLADSGLAIRTPGGAMTSPSGSMEKSFLERSARMAGAKDAIGREAARLVHDGEILVLDSGTTTRYLARHLASKCNVTAVTTSLAVLEELAGSSSVQVRLTGGAYRRTSHDLSGNSALEALGNIHADKVFFGAAAVSFQKGVMNYDAEMPKAFLRAGRERILLVDSSKIGTEAVYRLCAVAKCDLVVTDQGVKATDLARLRKWTSVLVAE